MAPAGFVPDPAAVERGIAYLAARGCRVLYFWTLTGINSGPGGTGRAVRVSGHEDWRIGADGLIAESLGHYDAAEYARQVQGS